MWSKNTVPKKKCNKVCLVLQIVTVSHNNVTLRYCYICYMFIHTEIVAVAVVLEDLIHLRSHQLSTEPPALDGT